MLLARLKERFPVATEFPSDSATHPDRYQSVPHLARPQSIYVEPSASEIRDYSEQAYPEWINQCEEQLASLHQSLQEHEQPPSFGFDVSNNGRRPARQSLITIQSHGHFLLKPLQNVDLDNETEEGETSDRFNLPNPPSPPKGHWRSTEIAKASAAHIEVHHPSIFDNVFANQFINANIDPNEFYYKHGYPENPVSEYELECEQWRHGMGSETFYSEIYLNDPTQDGEGAVSIFIQADNLTEPLEKTLPIRISIQPTEIWDKAKALVEEL